MDNWILYLGKMIDTIVSSYVANVVATLATALTPVVVTVMTLWWCLVGFSVIKGEINEAVTTIAWKVLKVSLIISLALNAGLYMNEISSVADGMRDGMASVFGAQARSLAGTLTNTTTDTTTVWSAIDAFDKASDALGSRMAEDISWYNLTGWLGWAAFELGSVALVVVGLFIAILTKIFLAFFLAIGPIAILCLLFPQTQRFFDGWLGMVLNAIVLCWIGLFILGVAMFVANDFATAGLNQWDTTNAAEEISPTAFGIKFLCLCLVFAVILLQAQSWSAALTGGSSFQMGVSQARQYITNRNLMRSRNVNNSRNSSANTNQITQAPAQARIANRIGYGTGAATRAIGTRVVAIGRATAGGARYAYQRAALLGRR